MPDDFPRDRPHLFLGANGETEPYRRPAQVINAPALPQRDRVAHAACRSAVQSGTRDEWSDLRHFM